MKTFSLITGGTSGIGLEIAKKLAAQGQNLFLVYMSNDERAHNAKKLLESINPNISIQLHKSNLSLKENAISLKSQMREAFSDQKLAHFISCHGRVSQALFVQKKLDSVLEMLNEHLLSNIILTHSLLPDMCVQKFGRVLFLTSVSAHKINRGQTDYSLSKAALENFVKSLTSEYFSRNITFNCICSGLTNQTAQKYYSASLQERVNPVPVEQVASLALYLLSQEASSISGAAYLIDSGYLCRNNNYDYQKLSFFSKNTASEKEK